MSHQKNLEAEINQPQPFSIPRPTVWPVTLSLGVTLLAFGVVTSWIMSAVGAVLFAVGFAGWFQELRQ